VSVFTAAIDNLFADPNIAREATYIADGGNPVLIRVVMRRADDVTSFGDARLWSETTRVDLRVAEVPNPCPGDRVEIDGEGFNLQGEPVRDRERLVWTVDLRPA
jgi:hypothetical protein